MEVFLKGLLPRILPENCAFNFLVFQGKQELLQNLKNRLRSYNPRSLDRDCWRIVVVVDRDNDDCSELKDKLERAAEDAGLRTRSQCPEEAWQVLNRIAVEELEAWYFGDWNAVCRAYPRVPPTVPERRGYRDPDSIQGGTWEAFERILKQHRYFRTGLRKIEAAEAIAPYIDPERNRSRSFKEFLDALVEATA